MNLKLITNHFEKFVPNETAPILAEWVLKSKINVIVKPKRKSKLGDFRGAKVNEPAQITINADLPPYSFLITFIHEFAHFLVWQKHKYSVAPHGKEWKSNFQKLLLDFIEKDVFPQDITEALLLHLQSPKSSACYDENLQKVLEKHSQSETLYLEDVKTFQIFQLENDERWFKKVKLLRKRYLCEDIESKKKYRISALARIKTLKSFS